MATQAINLELPEDIYRRLTDVAALTRQPLEEVIFQTLRGNLPPVLADLDRKHSALVAELPSFSDAALWAIAREPVPSTQWRKHQRLLHRGELGTLTAAEHAELARLREDTDRFVLRRSYALALLKWRGHTIPAVP